MKRYIVALLIIVVLFVCGCATREKKEDKEYSVTSMKIDCETMKEKLLDGAYLIDVRSVEEYNLGTLDFAKNVPVDEIEKIVDVVPDKETTIIVFCRSGNRSNTAANKLIDMGYTHIFDLGAMDNCSK